jgi:hypothetical protein
MKNIIKKPKLSEFEHQPSGHCETGGTASMLCNHGMKISEPMVFGITSGIIFFYMPLVKIWNNPLISYRMAPRYVIKGLQKRLGVRFDMREIKDQKEAMDELDRLLAEGQAVGCTAGISALPYFLPEMRVYFNAHTVIVIGKKGDEYILSDPIFDHTTMCPAKDLQRARYVKGANAPNGFRWYPVFIPDPAEIDWKPIIKKAIKSTVSMMLQPIFPFVGIKAIKVVANKIKKMQKEPDKKKVKSFLNHIILFQEEIGTGGGGFRYIYAAFLKEVYDILKIPDLQKASTMMLETGDIMRNMAVALAKVVRGKQDPSDLSEVIGLMGEWIKSETEVYKILKKMKWN